ncbi:MAG: aminotransferase class V-fold PLP-dependent enzyme [Sarcina sp.]
MKDIIYLDNAATTFPKPEKVYEIVDYINRNLAVNSGRGSYSLSRKASVVITETREAIAGLLGVQNPNKVIFTASATVAINQILNGIDFGNVNNVYVSPFEHNAIMRTIHQLKKKNGFKINIIPFNPETLELDEKKLKIMVANEPADMILMSHVSNVTGLILPINEIVKISKNESTVILIDASQSAGLVPTNFSEYDFLVFAGHKTLYGPFGIAGFVKNTNIKLKTVLVGGTGSDSTNLEMPDEMPYKYESGSYNIQAIAGVGESTKWIKSNGIDRIFEKKKNLTKLLVKELQEIEEVKLYIPKDEEKHVGIVSLTIEGFDSTEFADILDDEFNIAVRAGHHCAPMVGKFLGGQAEEGVLRISLGYFNTEKDIIAVKDAILDIVRG